MVLVGVADNGLGVPDEMKSHIFDHFRKGGQEWKRVGPFHCQEYGGRIWADDRVPGRPEEGAEIRFILKAAGIKE